MKLVTYQLSVQVQSDIRVQIGRLGKFEFPAGSYVYTGSAKRHLEARVARHLRTDKKLRWHIDYLLNHVAVAVTEVQRSSLPECVLNQSVSGVVIVSQFGASDCNAGCVSHLKKIS